MFGCEVEVQGEENRAKGVGSASSETAVAGRGRKGGHREWGATLHPMLSGFLYYRTMRLTYTRDQYHDASGKYALYHYISPCEAHEAERNLGPSGIQYLTS